MSGESVSRRMPRPRKITLSVILSMAFTNSVLLVVTLVRPVPQFSSSGTLMSISARGYATLSKRGLFEEYEKLRENDADGASQVAWEEEGMFLSSHTRTSNTASVTTPLSMHNRRPGQENDNTDDEGWFIEETHQPEPSTAEDKTTRDDTDSVTSDSNDIYFLTTSSSISSSPEAAKVSTAKTIDEYSTSTSTSVSISEDKNEHIVKGISKARANGWVEMWIGPLGVCIQRGNGTIACSKASITNNFLSVYQQADLNEDIKTRLPHTLKGYPVALLLAALTYIVCTVIFVITLAPTFSMYTKFGHSKSMDVLHQTSLAINTVLCTIALFLVLIPTFSLRNIFLKIVKSIPAFDVDLTANMGGAFNQLYACSILGALILLQSIVLVSEDLRKPWWLLLNTRRRNPFQTNIKGIDFTAHRQLRQQAEAEAQAHADALANLAPNDYSPESVYDDGMSRYAPTGLVPPEIAPPGGSVFIPARARRGRTTTRSEQSTPHLPRPNISSEARSTVASTIRPVMYRRPSGSVAPSMSVHVRPGSPDFPPKGW